MAPNEVRFIEEMTNELIAFCEFRRNGARSLYGLVLVEWIFKGIEY
jgi:hypothetical protein